MNISDLGPQTRIALEKYLELRDQLRHPFMSTYVAHVEISEAILGDLGIDTSWEQAAMNEPHFSLSPKASVSTAEGYVYLLKSGDHYKIGRSKDVPGRINQIGTKLPLPVEFICSIKTSDCVAEERLWHATFQNKRTNGEWFALTPVDVLKIKSACGVAV